MVPGKDDPDIPGIVFYANHSMELAASTAISTEHWSYLFGVSEQMRMQPTSQSIDELLFILPQLPIYVYT